MHNEKLKKNLFFQKSAKKRFLLYRAGGGALERYGLVRNL